MIAPSEGSIGQQGSRRDPTKQAIYITYLPTYYVREARTLHGG